MPMFELRGNIVHVLADNGKEAGQIYQEIDGDYVFWPSGRSDGFWEGAMLKAIADKVLALNGQRDGLQALLVAAQEVVAMLEYHETPRNVLYRLKEAVRLAEGDDELTALPKQATKATD